MLKFNAEFEDELSEDECTMCTLLLSTNKFAMGLLSSSIIFEMEDLPLSVEYPDACRREKDEYILYFTHEDVVCRCWNAMQGSSRKRNWRTDSDKAELRRGRRIDDLDVIVVNKRVEARNSKTLDIPIIALYQCSIQNSNASRRGEKIAIFSRRTRWRRA